MVTTQKAANALSEAVLAQEAVTAAVEPKAAFWSKMAVVLTESTRIPKNGRNKEQGYDYVMESDVIATMREVIRAAGLAFAAEVSSAETVYEGKTAKGGDKLIVRVGMTFTYVDTDTGHSEQFTCFGDGYDNSDKAIYKAITGATKYHLCKMFLIPTGDDPEENGDTEPTTRHDSAPAKSGGASENQVKAIFGKAKALDMSNDVLFAAVQRDTGKEHPEQLTGAEARALLDKMQKAIDERDNAAAAGIAPEEY